MFSRTPRFAWRFREVTGEIFFRTFATKYAVAPSAVGRASHCVANAAQRGAREVCRGRANAAHLAGRKSPAPRSQVVDFTHYFCVQNFSRFEPARGRGFGSHSTLRAPGFRRQATLRAARFGRRAAMTIHPPPNVRSGSYRRAQKPRVLLICESRRAAVSRVRALAACPAAAKLPRGMPNRIVDGPRGLSVSVRAVHIRGRSQSPHSRRVS
jgi:hypothetical protein